MPRGFCLSKKILVANCSWLILDKIYRATTNLLLIGYVSRYIGLEKVGILNYCVSLVSIFAFLATFGLDHIITKELSSGRKGVVENSIIAQLFGNFLTLIIFLFLKDRLGNYFPYILVLLLGNFFNSFMSLDNFYKINFKNKIIFKIGLISSTAIMLLKIILVQLQFDFFYFVLLQSIELFLLCILRLFFYYFDSKMKLNIRLINIKSIISLLKKSWPLMMSFLMVTFYSKIDLLMIENILSSQETGKYTLILKISEMWLFIPVAIIQSYYPLLLKESNALIRNKKIINLFSTILYITLFANLFITVFCTHIVKIVLGKQFLMLCPFIKLNVWGSTFTMLSSITNYLYVIDNAQINSFLKNTLSALTNVILNVILINRIGIKGAIYASLISKFFSCFIYDAISKKNNKYLSQKIRSIFNFNFLFFEGGK